MVNNQTKKLKAEKREEERKKLKSRELGFAAQKKRMEASKNYEGDVKKYVKG